MYAMVNQHSLFIANTALKCFRFSIYVQRMINLQEAKSALGKGSLQKLSSEERKQARITALKGRLESIVFYTCVE
jgi:hypothetical protein